MQFVDEVTIEVFGGGGGKGCVAFLREKFRPMGGPSGGDGGDGGDVILHAHDRLSTLMDLRYRRRFKGGDGEAGRGKDQYGANGKDTVVLVPVGTQVFDEANGDLIADLDAHDQRIVIAKGGEGGNGNIKFSSSFDRAPRHADDGTPGEELKLRLELKLMADVALVGFPNVGKSTFIAKVSRATPKIADYPFTTLVPNLGVAYLGDERSFVVADIPGIIEGASEGAGLGLRFLRHAERNRVLFHVLTVDPDPEREPLDDFDRLLIELQKYSPLLAERPMLVGLAKTDLPEVREIEDELRAALKERGHELHSFSAATGDGIPEALEALERALEANPRDALPKPKIQRRAVDRPHGNDKGYAEREES
ncbi:MAG: GTP-binding protein [Polyangiales bacterium]|jgi:GTP-binding protein